MRAAKPVPMKILSGGSAELGIALFGELQPIAIAASPELR
jgi:hypothetical protein